jgi:ubiquinone/menaquinone biosynthesis C-methylase UbiE
MWIQYIFKDVRHSNITQCGECCDRRDTFGDTRIAFLSKILDLSCETGRYSGALAERFCTQVIGLDLSEKMLAEARPKTASGGCDTVRLEHNH